MRVVAFVSACAKSGRTTLVCNLAVQAERATAGPIALIDATPDVALAGWSTMRGERGPPVTAATTETLSEALTKLRDEGKSHAFIDTPAQPDADLERIISFADLVIIPALASGDDARAIGATVELVERAGKPFIFVVNRGNPRQPLTAATAMALAQHGTLCPVVLSREAAFARCLAAGETVTESDQDSDPAKAIAELWSYVDQRIAASQEQPEADDRNRSFENRRAFPRWQLAWDVVLIHDGSETKCRLNDISGGGVSISTRTRIGSGDQVCLDIPHFGRLDAKVTHVRDGCAGLAFIMDAQAQWRLAERLSGIIGDAKQDSRTAAQSSARPSQPAKQRGVDIPAASVAAPASRPPSWHGAAACRVIVIGNEKGGCGKSTVAMHLLVALLREGRRVASIDLDQRQGTLTRYVDNRNAHAELSGLHLPAPVKHIRWDDDDDAGRLAAAVTRLAKRADFIVIDTPGQDSRLTRAAYDMADTVITPVNDSFVDLDTIAHVEAASLKLRAPGQFGQVIMQARDARADATGDILDWIVVRNRLSSLDARNKRDVADTLAKLAPTLGFRAGPGLSERVIYRELFLHGLTLLDLRERDVGVKLTVSHIAARQELRALLDAVLASPRTNARKAA